MAEQRNIPADLVEIGTLARPHGIRGEIRVNYYADSLELLRGDVVYLQAGNKPPRKMEIDTIRMHQGTPADPVCRGPRSHGRRIPARADASHSRIRVART